jgi:hypothetical protein
MTPEQEAAFNDYYRVKGEGPPEGTSKQDQQAYIDGLPVLQATHDHVGFRTLILKTPDGTTLMWDYRFPGAGS